MTDPVIIGIATYDGPGRRESLRETLDCLVGQVDREVSDEMIVYCNDYIPRGSFALEFDDLYMYSGQVLLYGDLGDSGKFYPFNGLGVDAYCFTCDDDLIYPADYVERMIEGIERYNRETVVSFHGRQLFGPVDSYYGATARHFPCTAATTGDNRVTVIGTGCLGWHSSLLSVSLDDFPHKNMADILFSKVCNDREIPRIVLGHEAGWIRHSKHIKYEDTIAGRKDNDELQTTVFNSVEWVL